MKRTPDRPAVSPAARTHRSMAASTREVSRRRFLGAAVAGTAGALGTFGAPERLVAAPAVARGRAADPPGTGLQLAGIGVGGVGFGQLQELEKAAFRIVALCDVDQVYAKKAFDRWPEARRYRDYRELFQAEGDRIDSVHVATPDHTHAVIVTEALRRKRHVCCVKPLTRTLEECRIVVESARRAGVATQVTASPNTGEEACRTCELIAAGAIGPVREVHVWSDRPVWPQGMQRPAGSEPVPGTIDWELWIGPAPMRPFRARWEPSDLAYAMVNIAGGGRSWYDAVYHPFNFRGWWDFGTGALGDMGCHYLNTPFRALALEQPTAIHASSTKVFEESAPLSSIVTLEYPTRAGHVPTRVVWYDGGLKPPMPRELEGERLPPDGVLYVGDEGLMLGSRILDPERAKRFESTPRTLERRGGTWREFAEACRGGPPAGCNFGWAGPITDAVLLGNVAIRRGKRLLWDGAARRITNDEAANGLIAPPYRSGWKLEPVG